jgi:hypothetical protein
MSHALTNRHTEKNRTLEAFSLDGGDLMFRDDSLGADPGELINCRCVCRYDTE